MNRCQIEMKAMARRMGERSLTDLLERRARERRTANLAYWGEDRREGERRESVNGN